MFSNILFIRVMLFWLNSLVFTLIYPELHSVLNHLYDLGKLCYSRKINSWSLYTLGSAISNDSEYLNAMLNNV